MNNEQLKHFKHLLIQHREEHSDILADMLEGAPEGYRDTEDSELSRYDNHPADAATDLFDAEHRAALRSNHEFVMREIDDALEKIKKETYGVCELCGKPIDPQRLEVIPDARNCIQCEISEEHENTLDQISKHSHRPVEEDVLEKVMRGHREGGRSEPYDGEQALEEVMSFGSSDSPQDGAPLGNRQDAASNGRSLHEVQDIEEISNEMYKKSLS
ncbi:MAG: TraR/DksA C4-type zinc finger protein [Thermoclostridium sp.]|nr:TraR/DksA C4-type zinc finger protein [Thermoclostridium sp.]